MRRLISALVTGVTGAFFLAVTLWVVAAPDVPFPARHNPFAPLDLSEPVSALTDLKLRRALATPEACLAALESYAVVEPLDPLVGQGGCGIDPRVRLSSVGAVAFTPLETTCEIALRLAAWERFVLQAEAQAHFGSSVTRLRHQSSYNCRTIRTEGGPSTRLSTHATAQAIDIAGVTLANGQTHELLGNWEGDSPPARFFRAIHRGACAWFVTVLGPDFNALHADHFHLQSVGWGSCR